MRIAIIGRTEILFETAQNLLKQGYTIPLIVTAKEASTYIKTAQDFQLLAEDIGAKYIQTVCISEIMDAVYSLPTIDIAVSINYPGIIPQVVIDFFPFGILNAHCGDLPRYRGNACQAWAILKGEKRVGLCIHKMVGDELDSGDIINRDYFPVNINTKITEVWNWMVSHTPKMFQIAIDRLRDDPTYVLERQSKKPEDALRCYPRKPEDGRIDWNKSAVDILRLINASNKPYAGAFCEFEERKMIVWDARLVEDNENYIAVSGQVITIGDGYFEVATGSGKLKVLEVEYKGNVVIPNTIVNSIRMRLK